MRNTNPPSLKHGSASTYTNHRCRCELCRKAWAAAHLDYMNRKPEQRKKNAERMITAYYKRRFPLDPELVMVSLVKYQYNPNYHIRKKTA